MQIVVELDLKPLAGDFAVVALDLVVILVDFVAAEYLIALLMLLLIKELLGEGNSLDIVDYHTASESSHFASFAAVLAFQSAAVPAASFD